MRIALGLLAVAAVAAAWIFVWSADGCYVSAERSFHQGDFEKALVQCEKALIRQPRHAPARALKTELQFILGMGKAPPATGDYDRILHGSLLPPTRMLVDLDQALLRAERHRLAGEGESARTEVRKILECLKWIPSGAETDARLHDVEVLQLRLAGSMTD